MMRRPRNSLARACGAAVCTCALAAGLVVVSEGGGPPSAAPPPVALAAAPKPLAASASDLIAHLGQFATLADPLLPEDVAPQRYMSASATATPGLATSVVGTTIANGVFRVAVFVASTGFQLVSPLLRIPGVDRVLGPIVLIGGIFTGLVAATVAAVVLQIDQAVSSLVGFIGSALGRLFRLPAALLSGATGVAGATAAVPGPTPRTTAFAVDGPIARTAAEPDVPNRAPSPPRQNDVDLPSPPPDSPKNDPEPTAAKPEPVTPDITEPSSGETTSVTKTPTDAAEPPAAPVKPRTKIRHAHGASERTSQDSTDDSPGPTSHKKSRTAPSHPQAPSHSEEPASADAPVS